MPMLLRSGLLRPDHPSWQHDMSYSPAAAGALRSAFTRVASANSSPDEFLWACGIVAPWLNANAAARQRVRVHLLIARA